MSLVKLCRMQKEMENILAPVIQEVRSETPKESPKSKPETQAKDSSTTEPFNVLRTLARRSSKSMASPQKLAHSLRSCNWRHYS